MPRVNEHLEHDSAGEGEGPRRPTGARARATRSIDPLFFSIPFLRLGRLRVLIHWSLPLYAGCELAAWLPRDLIGAQMVPIILGALLLSSILREIGRGCWARSLGSGVSHIRVWPLGGLNMVSDARTPSAATELGGLIAGLVMAVGFAVALVACGLPADQLLFDPFSPRQSLVGIG